MEGVSLRPGGAGLGLRPGGSTGGLLSAFALGSRPKHSAGGAGGKDEKAYDEVIKYSRDFLMAFKERCVNVPAELEHSGTAAEVLLGSADNEFVSAEERLESRASSAKPPADDRDWRSRAEVAPLREAGGNGGGGGGGGGGGKRGGGNMRSGGTSKGEGMVDRTPLPAGEAGAEIVRAANPWTRAGPADELERLRRNVKGVLNKITPEKFDRLMEQLLDLGISTAEMLKETISLIFDKAIWEPTFCPLYAEMCVGLSKALPEFSPVEGEDKPLTFRRVLLNTCQEEFEGAAQARAALETITDPYEREAAERKVKLRTMGNIRLIGELYKTKMIVERILHSCIGELLGKPKTDPPEENVEALVNLLVTVGKELDASPRSSTFMEAYFARLLQLSTSKKLPSRLRFLCRDIIDLRKNNWVPRREKLQAKKLDQVRADAAVALGIVKPQDENLFPEGPNGPAEDGWSVAGKKNKPKVDEGYSALTGQYVPSASKSLPSDRPRRDAKPAAKAEPAPEVAEDVPAAPAAPAAEPAKPAPEKKKAAAKLTAEEVPEQCSKLFAEYKSAADLKEALLCVQDIQKRAPDAAAATELLCVMAVQDVVDDSTERVAEQMTKLLSYVAEHGAVGAEPLQAALGKQLAQLDDLAIDVPMAPKLLGIVLGGLLSSKALEVAYLRTGCEQVEDMLYRRDLAVATLAHIKAAGSPPLLKLSVDVPLKDFLTNEDEDAASLIALFEKKGLPASLLPA